MDRKLFKDLFKRCNIAHDPSKPVLMVFRETGMGLGGPYYQPDDGSNNCDTIVLWQGADFLILKGRSIPHKKYQRLKMLGKGECNRIAPSYTADALRKGEHRIKGVGYPAWIQNKKFFVLRTRDMTWGNLDDYAERGLQWDNFHGFAPYSAGCITVDGVMANPWESSNGDWMRAMEWTHNVHPTPFLSVAVFEHDDLIDERRSIRIGSTGPTVKRVQRDFGITADGDYGPLTFSTLAEFWKGPLGRKEPFNGVWYL